MPSALGPDKKPSPARVMEQRPVKLDGIAHNPGFKTTYEDGAESAPEPGVNPIQGVHPTKGP